MDDQEEDEVWWFLVVLGFRKNRALLLRSPFVFLVKLLASGFHISVALDCML